MKKNSILKWVVVLSITIVLNLLFNYSLDLIFERPVYNEYCTRTINKIETMEMCQDSGYVWISNESVVGGYCDIFANCQAAWDEAREGFELNVFVSLISLGVVTLLLSISINNYVVSLGLGLGAFLDFLIASVRYWSYSSEILRIAILITALVSLIWIGVKKLGDK